MKKIIILLLSFSVSLIFSEIIWETNLFEAEKKAQTEDKNILLIFSGSDWCAPCIKLKNEILTTKDFEIYAQNNLVIVNADFPKRKQNKLKYNEEQLTHFDYLAERFNIEGYFPKVILLDYKSNILGDISYENITPLSYITKLKTFYPKEEKNIYKKSLKLMGSDFEISVSGTDKNETSKLIELAISEIKRIEDLISSWNPNSQTSEINTFAGIKPVKINQELLNLIERSINISELTQGAFDITYASMDKVWKFDGSMKVEPSTEIIKNSVSKVDYKKIEINKENSTIFLKDKGMKIGFGAIGKGYAADKAVKLLKDNEVETGVINASGDLYAWGKDSNDSHLKVGIKNPLDKDNIFGWIEIHEKAIATSGNYEKYVEFKGKRFGHIIDPRTGYPSIGILSVSVISNSVELSDALATALFVMGLENGLFFINQLKDVDCVIIDNDFISHTSNGIKFQ